MVGNEKVNKTAVHFQTTELALSIYKTLEKIMEQKNVEECKIVISI